MAANANDDQVAPILVLEKDDEVSRRLAAANPEAEYLVTLTGRGFDEHEAEGKFQFYWSYWKGEQNLLYSTKDLGAHGFGELRDFHLGKALRRKAVRAGKKPLMVSAQKLTAADYQLIDNAFQGMKDALFAKPELRLQKVLAVLKRQNSETDPGLHSEWKMLLLFNDLSVIAVNANKPLDRNVLNGDLNEGQQRKVVDALYQQDEQLWAHHVTSNPVTLEASPPRLLQLLLLVEQKATANSRLRNARWTDESDSFTDRLPHYSVFLPVLNQKEEPYSHLTGDILYDPRSMVPQDCRKDWWLCHSCGTFLFWNRGAMVVHLAKSGATHRGMRVPPVLQEKEVRELGYPYGLVKRNLALFEASGRDWHDEKARKIICQRERYFPKAGRHCRV